MLRAASRARALDASRGAAPLRAGTESVGFAPPPPPMFFCGMMAGPPVGMGMAMRHGGPDMGCSPMGPPLCLPPHMMPQMGEILSAHARISSAANLVSFRRGSRLTRVL